MVAHSQVRNLFTNGFIVFNLNNLFVKARDNPTVKTNSLPARGLGNSRTAF